MDRWEWALLGLGMVRLVFIVIAVTYVGTLVINALKGLATC